MPADYGLTIDKLIDHNKLQNKMIAGQIDELTILRGKLATVELMQYLHTFYSCIV